MDQVLRIYEPDELGRDGYPLAWHARPDGDPIKRMIRERDGNRCLRCGHPYHVGRSYRMEFVYDDQGEVEKRILWSPCDQGCHHTGEVMIEQDLHVMTTPADIGHWVKQGFVVEAAYRILTVHHLNETKADCRWWNLVSLCQRCHLAIQRKVHLERLYPFEHSPWFKPFVSGYYASAYLQEEITMEEAVARMDELLALERTS